MSRSRWMRHRTGYGAFVVGTGMGLITNLVSGDPERWPAALRPVAANAPAIGAALLVAVGVKALWDKKRNAIARQEWAGVNPYPGLVPYAGPWAAVFFGRNREVRDLVERVSHAAAVTERFVPVVGPSGSGKSSLVLAGLLPALSGRGWRILPAFTPGYTALTELATVLGVDVANGVGNEDSWDLDSVLAALTKLRGTERRLLMIVDQLEEAASQNTDDDRQRFMGVLQALAEREPRLCIVATVRSEWLGRFQQGAGADLFVNPLMVNVMDSHGLRLVITEPARLTDTIFDAGLVDEIVKEAGGGDALPLLSCFLSDLYDQAGSDHHISWAEYQASGGVPTVIHRRAEAAVRSLGQDALARSLNTLLMFVTFSEGEPARQRVFDSTLTEVQRDVVQAFERARLLTSDIHDKKHKFYEVAHEALLRQWPPLRDHIATHSELLRDLAELAPLARAWKRSGEQSDYLLSGKRLDEALVRSASGIPVPADLKAFLAESQQHRLADRERRADTAARHALSILDSDPVSAINVAYAACSELEPTALATYALGMSLWSGVLNVHRHPGTVFSVAFDTEGHLATGCSDGNVRVWGPDGHLQETFAASQGSVLSMAFARDGRLACGLSDKDIEVWDRSTGSRQRLTGHTAPVVTVAFADDGRLASGSEDRTIRLWDRHGRLLTTITDHTAYVQGLAFAPDGRLASASADRTVRVWDKNGQSLFIHALPGPRTSAWSVAFAADGRLAAGSRDCNVRIWDRSGRLLHTLRDHNHTVISLAFSAEGLLATGSVDKTVGVWNDRGEKLHTLLGHTGSVMSLAFSSDGRLATGSADDTTRVWNLKTRLLRLVREDRAAFNSIAFAADGRLAAGSGDRTAYVWTGNTGRMTKLDGHGGPVWAVAFGPGGRLATGSEDTTVRIWDSDHQPINVLTGHTNAIWAVAFAPDGRLASGSSDSTVRHWSSDGELIDTITSHKSTVWVVAYSADGRFASGSDDGTVELRDSAAELIGTYRRPIAVSSIAFAPDGRLATGWTDGGIHILDCQGQVSQTISAHSRRVWAIAFAPDGRMATASPDKTVKIWDTDGQFLHTLAAQSSSVVSLAFAADNRLATASAEGIQVWPGRTTLSTLLTSAASLGTNRLTPLQREAALLPPPQARHA